MAISGVSNYGNNYQYQNMTDLLRLGSYQTNAAQSVKAAERVNSVQKGSTSDNTKTGTTSGTSTATSGSTSSIRGFLDSYESALSSLENAASRLRLSSSSNVFNTFEAASTNEEVATISKNYKLEGDTDITLEVNALATAQKNNSASHYATEQVESGADMNFTIQGPNGNASVSVSSTHKNGVAKTYKEMYQEAANVINQQSRSGVRASVVNDNGKVSLVLTGRETGAKAGFEVTGNTGAAAGLENASVQAQNANYTVTQDGVSTTMESATNTVSLDYGRMTAQLKSVGETNVYTGIDSDKVVSAVKDLMDSYNSVQSILSQNADRGTGAANQLSAFNRGMAAEKTLKAIGITYDKNGKMQLDEEKLTEALQTDFNETRSLIGGQFGIAEKAAARAESALSESLNSVISNEVSSSKTTGTNSANSSALKSMGLGESFQYFASFARSGPYNLGNYYAVGMLLNTWG